MSQSKQVRIQQGDDLRAIALRELRDPSRWAELSTLNGLRHPYIIDSYKAQDRLPHTVIWGDTILVPAVTNAARAPTAASTFGVDIGLVGGKLATLDGDLATLAGGDNLVQALSNRIKTLRGELVYHAEYGSSVSLALGLQAKPIIELMAGAWAVESLREEPRLSSIEAVQASASGDILRVAARVMAANDNTPTDVNLVLNP